MLNSPLLEVGGKGPPSWGERGGGGEEGRKADFAVSNEAPLVFPEKSGSRFKTLPASMASFAIKVQSKSTWALARAGAARSRGPGPRVSLTEEEALALLRGRELFPAQPLMSPGGPPAPQLAPRRGHHEAGA